MLPYARPSNAPLPLDNSQMRPASAVSAADSVVAAPDAPQPFAEWYEGFRDRTFRQRNPSRAFSTDPRLADGPWGIQRAANARPLLEGASMSLPSNAKRPAIPIPTHGSERYGGHPIAHFDAASSGYNMYADRPSSHDAYVCGHAAPLQPRVPYGFVEVPTAPTAPPATLAREEVAPPPPPFSVVPLGTPQLPYEATLPTPQGRAALRAFTEERNAAASAREAGAALGSGVKASSSLPARSRLGAAGDAYKYGVGGEPSQRLYVRRPEPIYGVDYGPAAAAAELVSPSNARLPPVLENHLTNTKKQEESGLAHSAPSAVRAGREMSDADYAKLKQQKYYDTYGWGSVAAIGAAAAATARREGTSPSAPPREQSGGLSGGRTNTTVSSPLTASQRREALQQQEEHIRRGIADAEAKHRAFIVAHSPAPVGPTAPARRAEDSAARYAAAVAVLSHHRAALSRVEGAESLRRKGIADGFAAWASLIAEKERTDRAAIAGRAAAVAAAVLEATGQAVWYDMNRGTYVLLSSAPSSAGPTANSFVGAGSSGVGQSAARDGGRVPSTANSSVRYPSFVYGGSGQGVGLSPHAPVVAALFAAEEAARGPIVRAEAAAADILAQRSRRLTEAVRSSFAKFLGRDVAPSAIAASSNSTFNAAFFSPNVADGTARGRAPSGRAPSARDAVAPTLPNFPSQIFGSSTIHDAQHADADAISSGWGLRTAVGHRVAAEWARQLSECEATESTGRDAIERAERGFLDTMTTAFALRTAAASQRQRSLAAVIRERFSPQRTTAALFAAEAEGRSSIAAAADGWWEAIAARRYSLLALTEERAVDLAKRIAAVMAKLPRLEDIEADEAARRRYLEKTYFEWCDQTLWPTARRLLGVQSVIWEATHTIRSGMAAQLSGVVAEEARGRSGIEAGEAEWRVTLRERARHERAVGVRRTVAEEIEDADLLRYAQQRAEWARERAAVEADETAKRSALLAAEAQWARFILSAAYPNGAPPSYEAVAMQRERDWEASAAARLVADREESLRRRPPSNASPTSKSVAAVTKEGRIGGAAPSVPWDTTADPIAGRAAQAVGVAASSGGRPSSKGLAVVKEAKRQGAEGSIGGGVPAEAIRVVRERFPSTRPIPDPFPPQHAPSVYNTPAADVYRGGSHPYPPYASSPHEQVEGYAFGYANMYASPNASGYYSGDSRPSSAIPLPLSEAYPHAPIRDSTAATAQAANRFALGSAGNCAATGMPPRPSTNIYRPL